MHSQQRYQLIPQGGLELGWTSRVVRPWGKETGHFYPHNNQWVDTEHPWRRGMTLEEGALFGWGQIPRDKFSFQLTPLQVVGRLSASFPKEGLGSLVRFFIHALSNWYLVLYRDIKSQILLQFQYLYSWTNSLTSPGPRISVRNKKINIFSNLLFSVLVKGNMK